MVETFPMEERTGNTVFKVNIRKTRKYPEILPVPF
jgi:hypothetical protein